MNTSEVAAALETEPKVLRRFLRADANYANAGAGGRYEFTDADIPEMRERFNAWESEKASKPRAVTSTRRAKGLTQDEALASERLPRNVLGRKLYASERSRRDAISRARVERLEAALLAKGLHISQMRSRDNVSA